MGDTGEGEAGGLTGLPQLLERAERQLERERQRTDWLMGLLGQQGSVLVRIEQRCTAIEQRLSSALTPTQWAKIIAGLALPLLVLVLTGNVELARKFMLP